MKKLVCVLACLMAVPAFGLTISLVDLGGGVVAVNYNADGDANQPRAFALNITVSGNAVITDVNGFDTYGESTAAHPGFGIYPGTIVIDSNGTVTDMGTPLAPSTDPGAGPNLPANAIVIELGSLYVGAANAPDTNGTLCNIVVDCNGDTTTNVNVTEENTYRGGIVLEDLSTPSPNLTATLAVSCAASDCYPSCRTAEYAQWVLVGKPDSWCTQRQCHGDADNAQEGDPKSGYFYVWSSDLNALVAGWKKVYSGNPTTDPWIAADFSHSAEGDPKSGYFRVWSSDLNILVANWKQAVVATDCLDCP